jgi:hypothetical protein
MAESTDNPALARAGMVKTRANRINPDTPDHRYRASTGAEPKAAGGANRKEP